MNITKGDVQELRRRLKKTECTFGRLCGCYVNSGREIISYLDESLGQMPQEEAEKYLGLLNTISTSRSRKRRSAARSAQTCWNWSLTAATAASSTRNTC